MTPEEIARKLCEQTYLRHREECEKEIDTSYSFGEYEERNRSYFLRQAQIYLQVKESLKAQDVAAAVYAAKRIEERDALTSSVFYMPVSGPIEHDLLWGVTIDVSRSGVGIYTSHALEEGSFVEVHSEDLWNNGRTARIKWCKEVRKKLYRSGLLFG